MMSRGGQTLRIGLAQLNSRQDKAANLQAAAEAIDRLAARGADLVLLPEMFNFHGVDEANAEAAEPIPGPSSEWAREQARRHGLFLHLGSLIERCLSGRSAEGEEEGARGDAQNPSSDPAQRAAGGDAAQGGANRLYNTSLVFDREGKEVARYRKIQLFDVRTPDGLEYSESKWITPGSEVVVFDCQGVKVGLAICYDLRFPELFHALADRGAQVILLPAAFTVPTGISHWEPLVRARAIENGCYVAACGQWGRYARGRQNYGHSMVVDPWGTVIAQCREGVDVVTCDLDLDYLTDVRERMPVHRHRRRDLFG